MQKRLIHHPWHMINFFLFIVYLTFSIIPASIALSAEIDVPASYTEGIETFENKDYILAEGLFRRALEENALFQEPTGRSAWYWLGLSLEMQEEPFSAIDAMLQGRDSLDSAGLTDRHLDYGLARMITTYRREELDSLVTPLMYEILQNVNRRDQPELWERLHGDMSFLLNAEEGAELEALSENPSATAAIFYRFFRREDPNPITPENEIFPLFFRRLHEAREQYTSYETNRGFDDRGAVHVRLGEPWKVNYDHIGIMGPQGHITYPYEIWFYSNVHPDAYYTFVQYRGHGDYEIVPGMESIFYPFYQGNYSLREYVGDVHMRIYSELAPIHPEFMNRFQRLQEQYSLAEAASYARMHFVSEDKFHLAGMDTLTPRIAAIDHSKEKLTLILRMLRFLESDGRIRTETYYAVPNRELYFDGRAGGVFTSLRGEIGIFDSTFQLVAHEPIYTAWQAEDPGSAEEGVFIGQFNTHLDPGDYNIFFRIENPNGNRETVVNSDFELDPFPESGLVISDVQFARSIEPAEGESIFNKRGYFIKPLVDYTIPNDKPFYIYFEVYHLTPSEDGATRAEITFTLDHEKEKKGFLGLFGKKLQTLRKHEETLTYTGDSSIQPFVHKFQFEDVEEDDYLLSIQVKDLNSQQTVNDEITISIF